MSDDLSELIARVEGATEDDQWDVLRDVAREVAPSDDNIRVRVNQLCDAGGYESAALALVERVGGDAWFWQVGHDEDDPAWFRARILPFPRRVVEAEGPTPALAVVHALLKALAVKEKDLEE